MNLSLTKQLSRAKKYAKGTIFPSNTASAEMYIILKGEVGAFINYKTPNEEMLHTIGSGEFFIETLFSGKNHRSTFAALSDVIMLPISNEKGLDFFKSEPEMSYELIKILIERLNNVSGAYEELSGRPWTEQKAPPIEPPAAGVNTAPKPAPVSAPAQIRTKCAAFSLFPDGHGSYQLPLTNDDREHLMEKSHTCPFCQKSFKALRVKPSKLVLERTDSDMRSHYKGVEPLYYEIATCPNCLYSAFSSMFEAPDRKKPDLLSELKDIKRDGLLFGANIDTFSVFAGYYLALLCAPKVFSKHQLAEAKLYLNLSQLYQDSEDKQMEEQTSAQALETYMYAYEKLDLMPAQYQQLCIIIGDLGLRQKNYKLAKNFYFKAKMDPQCAPLIKKQAEDRIETVRNLEKEE